MDEEKLTGKKRKLTQREETEPPQKKRKTEVEEIRKREKEFIKKYDGSAIYDFVGFDHTDSIKPGIYKDREFEVYNLFKGTATHNKRIDQIKDKVKEIADFIEENLPFIKANGISALYALKEVKYQVDETIKRIKKLRNNTPCGLCGVCEVQIPMRFLGTGGVTILDSMGRLICDKCKRHASCYNWRSKIKGDIEE